MIKITNRQYAGFDIAKLIMCICVVAIHTTGKYGFYPFLRIAVPMFFCISSYLFFKRADGKPGIDLLKNYLLRNAKLYVFWFIALLVPTLVVGKWLVGNLLLNFVKFLFRIVFGSTFPASWYIPALMICVAVVWLAKQKIPTWAILCGAFLIYAFGCIASNYRGLLAENTLLYSAILIYPGTVYNSFPVGLFWVALGAFFAEKEEVNNWSSICSLCLSIILLVAEYLVICKLGCMTDNDCYFMLVPVCYYLMKYLIGCNVEISLTIARVMRNVSTIVYCVHGTVANMLIIFAIPDHNTLGMTLMLFLATTLISIVIAAIILLLEKKKGLTWLRLAH